MPNFRWGLIPHRVIRPFPIGILTQLGICLGSLIFIVIRSSEQSPYEGSRLRYLEPT